MPTIKMCDRPVILATASAASIRSLWLMRFIDREGVPTRVAGVALLHTGILPRELLYDGFGGRVQNVSPRAVSREVPATLYLACKRFTRAGEGFPGVI